MRFSIIGLKQTSFVCAASLMALLMVVGCATESMRRGPEPETPEGLNVDPAAYGADSFTYNKRMKARPAVSDIFYYKHCGQTGHQTWYSKTNYACSEFGN